MAEKLVVLMIGVIVNADTKEAAIKKAIAPFHYGAIPSVVAITATGCRDAKPDDRTGIQDRLNAMAKEHREKQENG